MTAEDPSELRRQAAQLRHAAQHAERLQDARAELAEAARLEARANVLEGRVPPPAPAAHSPKPATSPSRDKKLAEALAEIERRFGRKPQ